MDRESPKYIAGLSETRGEYVTRALRNVFDKMCQLEKDKKEAKRESDLTNARKDATAQSLKEVQATHAVAEARCNLLELQLHHIRTLLGRSLNGVIWDDIQTETKSISTATDTYQSNSRIRKTVSKSSHDDNTNLGSRETPSREVAQNQQVLPNLTPISNSDQFSSIERGRSGSYPEDSLSSLTLHYPSAPLPPEEDIGTLTMPHNVSPLHNSKQTPNSSHIMHHTQSFSQPDELPYVSMANTRCNDYSNNIKNSIPSNLQATVEEGLLTNSSLYDHSGQHSFMKMPENVSEGPFGHSGSTSDIIPMPSDEFNHIMGRPNVETVSEHPFEHSGSNNDVTALGKFSREISRSNLETVTEGTFGHSGSTSDIIPMSGEFNRIMSNLENDPQYSRSVYNDSGQQSTCRILESENSASVRSRICSSGHPTPDLTTVVSGQTTDVTTTDHHITDAATSGQYTTDVASTLTEGLLFSHDLSEQHITNMTSATSASFTGISGEGSPSYGHSGQHTNVTTASTTNSIPQGNRGTIPVITLKSSKGLEKVAHEHCAQQVTETRCSSEKEAQQKRSLHKSSELHTIDTSPIVSANLTDTVEEGPISNRSLLGALNCISESTPRFSSSLGGTIEEGPLPSSSIQDNPVPCITIKQKDGTIYHIKNELVRSYEHKKKLPADSHPVILDQSLTGTAWKNKQDDTPQTRPKVVDDGKSKRPSRNKSSSRQSSKSRSISKKPAPFILGKSTGDSHSVPANMQNVRNILKNGSGKLRSLSKQSSTRNSQERSARSSSINVNDNNLRYDGDLGSTREDIKDVMLQLEEEKAILLQEIFKCENLMSGAAHPSLIQCMTPELNNLKQRLKAKSLQISRLNTLLQMIGCPSKQQQFHSQTATLSKDKPGHLFVTTEITTRPNSKSIEVQTTLTKVSKTPEKPRNSEISANRQFLHELRDIKHSLQENNR